MFASQGRPWWVWPEGPPHLPLSSSLQVEVITLFMGRKGDGEREKRGVGQMGRVQVDLQPKRVMFWTVKGCAVIWERLGGHVTFSSQIQPEKCRVCCACSGINEDLIWGGGYKSIKTDGKAMQVTVKMCVYGSTDWLLSNFLHLLTAYTLVQQAAKHFALRKLSMSWSRVWWELPKHNKNYLWRPVVKVSPGNAWQPFTKCCPLIMVS